MANAIEADMDVATFLSWAEGREGRWELRNGKPVMMTREGALHALTKYAAQKALESGIKRADLPCRMFPDGMIVRIASSEAYGPDALVVVPSPPPNEAHTLRKGSARLDPPSEPARSSPRRCGG
jgi:Uma2 family endonuclease